MPKINPRTSDRVEKAFFLHKKHRKPNFPLLMKLSNFSKREQEKHAIRMCIYHQIKKFALNTEKSYLSPPNTVMCTVEKDTLSSATDSSFTPPRETEVKRIWMTAYTSQTARQARNQKQARYKIAFKHATMVYSREKAKKCGMLTQDFSTLIKNQFQENITARTIQ